MTAQEIIDLRKKLGMSQVIFAERLGVSFATVNRWENGRHIPSPLAVEKIKSLGSSMPVSDPPRQNMAAQIRTETITKVCFPTCTTKV